MSGLMDTPGRTSYIQLQLVEEQHNLSLVQVRLQLIVIVLLCSSAVLDPRVGHTMDVLSPFIPVLCHSD